MPRRHRETAAPTGAVLSSLLRSRAAIGSGGPTKYAISGILAAILAGPLDLHTKTFSSQMMVLRSFEFIMLGFGGERGASWTRYSSLGRKAAGVGPTAISASTEYRCCRIFCGRQISHTRTAAPPASHWQCPPPFPLSSPPSPRPCRIGETPSCEREASPRLAGGYGRDGRGYHISQSQVRTDLWLPEDSRCVGFGLGPARESVQANDENSIDQQEGEHTAHSPSPGLPARKQDVATGAAAVHA